MIPGRLRFVLRPGIRWPVGLAAGCGLLAALPWVSPSSFPATWMAMAAWIAITPPAPRVACGLWLAGGVAFIGVALYWLPEAASLRFGINYWSALPAAAIVILWDALQFGVFGYVAGWLRQRGRSNPLVWPVVWVALELVWPHVFPWRIGQTQVGWLSLCQVAEFSGACGISFLVVWTSAAVGTSLRELSLSVRWPTHRPSWSAVALPVLLVAVASVWGEWRITEIERSSDDRRHLRVGLVQSGTRSDGRIESPRSPSREIACDVDLIVWGEATIGEYPLSLMKFAWRPEGDGSGYGGQANDAASPQLGVPLLCGGTSYIAGARRSEPLRNTAFLIGADHSILGRYHKRVLMPWGEYACGQDWIPGFRRLFGQGGNYIDGTSATPLTLPGFGQIGLLICYEDLTADPARQTVREGAQVLFNLNKLVRFGETSAAAQHQRLAVIRAIENRRWLVRCGTTGSTAVISATGRVVCQAPLYHPAVLTSTVSLLDRSTAYTRWGDGWVWLCGAVTMLWCLLAVADRGRF